jgi:hypothetical protein
VFYRPTTPRPLQAAQAVCSLATVAGVVLLVLTLLGLTVYAVVFVDIVPQMQ